MLAKSAIQNEFLVENEAHFHASCYGKVSRLAATKKNLNNEFFEQRDEFMIN